jgi:tripartite-type tricarboxylate transporter receptor subunit TctC
MRRRSFAQWFTCAAIASAASLTNAQTWPNGPVRVIVPFAPASTPDLVARVVFERLGARLGATMIVENKGGAAGNLGTDAVAKAQPDGQTIGLGIAGTLGVNALLFKKLAFNPERDLQLVTIAATQPAVLVVSNKLAANSTAELLALMKQNRSKYSFSSLGAGSVAHLAMETLSSRVDADLVHVPYKGSGAAVTAVISGEVDMAVLPAGAVMPHVKAGKIKALAVASAKRSTLLPELPTLAEGGVQDIQADAWIGVVVPAKTPAPIVTRLQAELLQILAEPAIKDKLRLAFMEPVGSTSAEFRKLLDADVARWKPVIQKYDITLD